MVSIVRHASWLRIRILPGEPANLREKHFQGAFDAPMMGVADTYRLCSGDEATRGIRGLLLVRYASHQVGMAIGSNHCRLINIGKDLPSKRRSRYYS